MNCFDWKLMPRSSLEWNIRSACVFTIKGIRQHYGVDTAAIKDAGPKTKRGGTSKNVSGMEWNIRSACVFTIGGSNVSAAFHCSSMSFYYGRLHLIRDRCSHHSIFRSKSNQRSAKRTRENFSTSREGTVTVARALRCWRAQNSRRLQKIFLGRFVSFGHRKGGGASGRHAETEPTNNGDNRKTFRVHFPFQLFELHFCDLGLALFEVGLGPQLVGLRFCDELAGYKYDPEAYKRRVRDREGWSEALADEADD